MRIKTKEKFEKVRELRSQGKTAREISNETNISKAMVCFIFRAIKHNYNSTLEYHNYVVRRIINPETGKNFSDRKEYHNYIVRRNGFRNESSYVRFRKLERKDNEESLSEQEKFEKSVKLFSFDRLDKKISEVKNLELEIENKDDLEILLNEIPERYRKILEMRYIEGRSQEETANILGVEHQRVQQIEKRAFEYFLYGKKIRDYETYNSIEDGELLLIHILSKSLETNNKSKIANVTDLDNEIYYGKRIKTEKQISFMIYGKKYKERLNKLKNKYFYLG